jgi:hypothetical protein
VCGGQQEQQQRVHEQECKQTARLVLCLCDTHAHVRQAGWSGATLFQCSTHWSVTVSSVSSSPVSPTLPGCTGRHCHVSPGLSRWHRTACRGWCSSGMHACMCTQCAPTVFGTWFSNPKHTAVCGVLLGVQQLESSFMSTWTHQKRLGERCRRRVGPSRVLAGVGLIAAGPACCLIGKSCRQTQAKEWSRKRPAAVG